MMQRLLCGMLLPVAFIAIFSGCSTKQYFNPEKTSSSPNVAHSYDSVIVDLSRDGATLKNGKYIGKSGLNTITLGEGYRFLSESQNYVLASNREGVLNIISKRKNESARAISLHVPVVSATIYKGIIAYVLNDNTFGVYQIIDNRKIIESRSKRTFAIDTRAASPIFIDNLAVIPMLDGKIIIVDGSNPDDAKVVYLSSEKVFNNVVYLSRIDHMIVAATPKKLITLGKGVKSEYRANISEVTVTDESVYLFSKEGEIIRLDKQLNPLAKKKFKYAHFAASTAFGGKVFALDQQGSLIVLSSDLSKYKVYDLGKVDSPVFITGSKLYKDSQIIELSKLGYE